jgi:hypothetical protein
MPVILSCAAHRKAELVGIDDDVGQGTEMRALLHDGHPTGLEVPRDLFPLQDVDGRVADMGRGIELVVDLILIKRHVAPRTRAMAVASMSGASSP